MKLAELGLTCRLAARQDIMRLDNSARMNLPGQAGGNWAWRMGGPEVWEHLAPEADALRALAETYGRLAPRVRGFWAVRALPKQPSLNPRPEPSRCGWRWTSVEAGVQSPGSLVGLEFPAYVLLRTAA